MQRNGEPIPGRVGVPPVVFRVPRNTPKRLCAWIVSRLGNVSRKMRDTAGKMPTLAAIFLFMFAPMSHAAPTIYVEKFDSGLKNWVVEQMPGGTVVAENGVLDIKDKDGCTVWFRQRLTAPVEISYEAMVVNEGK